MTSAGGYYQVDLPLHPSDTHQVARQLPKPWWEPNRWIKASLGGVNALASVAGAAAAYYFFDNPIITASAAIGSGLCGQLAVESTPKIIRTAVGHFNLKWSAAMMIGGQQILLNCTNKDLACTILNKTTVTFLRGIGAAQLVASVLLALRRTKDDEPTSASVEPIYGRRSHPIRMLEPDSACSFWVFKGMQMAAGAGLLVMVYVEPSYNLLGMAGDVGAFLAGYGACSVVTRLFWEKWQEEEWEHQVEPGVPDGAGSQSNLSLKLELFRRIAAICDGIGKNTLGFLFIISPTSSSIPAWAPLISYFCIGGNLGSRKFVEQQKFCATQRIVTHPLLRTTADKVAFAVKMALTTGVAGYLLYSMQAKPIVEWEITVLVFGASLLGSNLLTSVVDEQFHRDSSNRGLNSLQFYLNQNSDFMGLPYFVIDQHGNSSHPILKYLAALSLGAALGNIPARWESASMQRELRAMPHIAQYEWGALILRSYQGDVMGGLDKNPFEAS